MVGGEAMDHPDQQVARLRNRHVEHHLARGDSVVEHLLEPGRCPEGLLQALGGGGKARDGAFKSELVELGVLLSELKIAFEAALKPVPESLATRLVAIAVLGAKPDRHQKERVVERHLAGEVGVQRRGLHLDPTRHLTQAERRHSLLAHHVTSRRQDRLPHLFPVPLAALRRRQQWRGRGVFCENHLGLAVSCGARH
jgi:hypothetical protein